MVDEGLHAVQSGKLLAVHRSVAYKGVIVGNVVDLEPCKLRNIMLFVVVIPKDV